MSSLEDRIVDLRIAVARLEEKASKLQAIQAEVDILEERVRDVEKELAAIGERFESRVQAALAEVRERLAFLSGQADGATINVDAGTTIGEVKSDQDVNIAGGDIGG